MSFTTAAGTIIAPVLPAPTVKEVYSVEINIAAAPILAVGFFFGIKNSKNGGAHFKSPD